MKKIIIVTKCLKNSLTSPGVAQFSFRGFYAGYKIKSLNIYHDSFPWDKDEEYIIYLIVTKITHHCLEGRALKIKKLKDFMMDC